VLLEKFDQAISDYTAGLKLKNDILPLHHRQIAEAYYKLGLVLDLTSGRLGDAIIHVQKAVESIDRRLELLRLRSEGDMPDAPPEDAKGKGKAPASALLKNDPIASLTADQMKAEIKEFEGLKKELENKVCRISQQSYS
jgi:HAT1-interacting factor 1